MTTRRVAVAKKVTKKATKKVAPKKKTTSKKTSTKKVAKTDAAAPVKKVTPKLSKKVQTKTSIKESAKTTSSNLLVLSPLRFPLDVDMLAIQTARFSGVMFLLLGGFFTLLNFSFLSIQTNSVQLPAMALDSQIITQTSESDADSTLTATSNQTQTFGYLQTSSLQGSTVSVTLLFEDMPDEVFLRGLNTATQKVFELGSMQNHADNKWQISFDTQNIDSGEYELQALAVYSQNDDVFSVVTVNDTKIRKIQNLEQVNPTETLNQLIEAKKATVLIQESYATSSDVSEETESVSQTGDLQDVGGISVATSTIEIDTETNSSEYPKETYEISNATSAVTDTNLVIKTISLESFSAQTEVKKNPVVLVIGSAPANSIITLSIFDTDTNAVVAVGDDGTWIYRLNTDLEDGVYKMFVAIVESDVGVVAKSSIFTFKKVGSAYVIWDEQPNVAAATIFTNLPRSSDSTLPLLLVIASISVVALGLILVMLGVHMHTRKHALEIKTKTDTVSAK